MIKGQPETSAPEALSVKRPPPKTKKERQGDCNAKMSAEQRRLNPMAAGEAEESKGGASKKPALTAEQRRLNPMAGMDDDKPAMTAEQRRLNPLAALGGGGGGDSKTRGKQMAVNVAK